MKFRTPATPYAVKIVIALAMLPGVAHADVAVPTTDAKTYCQARPGMESECLEIQYAARTQMKIFWAKLSEKSQRECAAVVERTGDYSAGEQCVFAFVGE